MHFTLSEALISICNWIFLQMVSFVASCPCYNESLPQTDLMVMAQLNNTWADTGLFIYTEKRFEFIAI